MGNEKTFFFIKSEFFRFFQIFKLKNDKPTVNQRCACALAVDKSTDVDALIFDAISLKVFFDGKSTIVDAPKFNANYKFNS